MDATEQINKFIERAMHNRHSTFRFIVSWSDYRYVKKYLVVQQAMAKSFKKAKNRQFKTYLQAVKINKDVAELLFSYRQYEHCANFYKDECAIIKDMIDEYVCYIHDCKLIKTLLGYVRPESDFFDWRKLPIKLF